MSYNVGDLIPYRRADRNGTETGNGLVVEVLPSRYIYPFVVLWEDDWRCRYSAKELEAIAADAARHLENRS